MTRTRCVATVFAVAAALAPGAAQAAPILMATSVSSSAGDSGGATALVNMINQDGLTVGYTSGVTDFDAYTAVAIHDAGPLSTGHGVAAIFSFPTIFTFDLGGLFSIDATALWQSWNGAYLAFGGFIVWADDDSDFGNGGLVPLLSDTLTIAPGAQVFSFAPVTTQFVHIEALSALTWISAGMGLSEVAWRQADAEAIPEPGTLLLIASGLAATGRRLRQRRT